ncbi:MAG: ribosome-associated translation inhibitor RaiA [Patescibacteria group bacterium]
MITTIHGTDIELTDALKQYAEEKISGLTKFFDNIQKAEIDIGLRSRHHQKGDIYYAEVNVIIPGHVVRVVKEEKNLYKAIDEVKDHLKVELQGMKEKMRKRDRQGLREGKEYQG